MTERRVLKGISVANLRTQVGISFAFETEAGETRMDHYIVPHKSADDLCDKIKSVLKAQEMQSPGDGVGVDDRAFLHITKPKETLQ